MTTPFVHLHVHTEYSMLDGACRVKDVTAAAKAMDMPAVAITDHGVMYGVVPFFEKAREKGVKPVIGCETYITGGRAPPNRRPTIWCSWRPMTWATAIW